MPNLPRLGATINLERERRFRLRASLPIVFAGLDMGSNDEMFWFEVPEGMSKTLYYARHDQYQQQLTRAILPVDPTWVMDALGLVQLDASAVVAGPITRTDGKLETRSTMPMPDGIYQRVCFIDPNAGYVTDQFLYAPAGNLIAKCAASQHRYYPEEQCATATSRGAASLSSGGPAPLDADRRLFLRDQSTAQRRSAVVHDADVGVSVSGSDDAGQWRSILGSRPDSHRADQLQCKCRNIATATRNDAVESTVAESLRDSDETHQSCWFLPWKGVPTIGPPINLQPLRGSKTWSQATCQDRN